jgi:voltage-gated potassium channel
MVWGRTVITVLVVIGVYLVLPLEARDLSGTRWVIRGLGLLVSLPALTWLIAHHVRRALFGGRLLNEQIAMLFTLVSVVVVFFASVCFLLAEQFRGLHTKVDALYFAVATLCTVGYGDITPTGQWARVVVIVQMLFNLVVVTSAVSIIIGAAGGKANQSVRAASERRG